MPITPAEARTLVADPELAELGLRPVAEDDADDALDAAVMDATLDHDVILDALYEAGGALVALGPDAVVQRGAVRKGARRPAAWWVKDDRLFLAHVVTALPELWVEVEPTRDAVIRAIAMRLPNEDAAERSFRFFFGLLPDFAQDFIGLENRLTIDPFCEGLPLVLGSAAPADGRSDCLDDPVHVSQFETVLSHSRIAISALHQMLDQGSIVIGTLEYRPAPHEEVVRAWNEAHGSDWPLDVPLDVLGAVGFSNGSSLATVERWLTEGGEGLPPPFAALVGAALLTAPGPAVADEATIERFLRGHMKHPDPDTRGVIGQLSAMFELSSLFEAMVSSETDPRVREGLSALKPS
jgi:hypothetical protein